MSKKSKQSEIPEPYLTPEEITGNLSLMERDLNRQMKCTAGRNQVYIRSLITGASTSRPRIAMKCPLRRDINEKPLIFYEQIRDLCCSDPDSCPAWQAFTVRMKKTEPGSEV